ncbi:hypothetical protein FHX15_005513 [Rhizobium sp. BK650]|uniref:hypothetical protein n=1 Tax=Rhizobium sp. BK650 TaxID=2586990 RepID=UPI0016105336|nr:hypothetical protein [Rhizobium sp. BK650]MBB3660244.1 hypothetical protein [Rhizobium sp. BK650]
MNLNDNVVYRRLQLRPLGQWYAGGAGGFDRCPTPFWTTTTPIRSRRVKATVR